MKTYISASLPLFLLILSGIAQASNQTNNPARGLVSQCKAALDPGVSRVMPPVAKCYSYIEGWLEGIDGTLLTDDKGLLQTASIEDGVTSNQVAKVYVQYMDSHPEEENKPRQVALQHAMLNSGLLTLVSPGK